MAIIKPNIPCLVAVWNRIIFLLFIWGTLNVYAENIIIRSVENKNNLSENNFCNFSNLSASLNNTTAIINTMPNDAAINSCFSWLNIILTKFTCSFFYKNAKVNSDVQRKLTFYTDFWRKNEQKL